jgi:hypothetical protein
MSSALLAPVMAVPPLPPLPLLAHAGDAASKSKK